MALSLYDAEQLKAAGFLEWEVEQFATATTPTGESQPPIDISSPIWQRVMESRRNWVADKIERGWSQDEIEAEAKRYYIAGKERTPWDFLKAEYQPPLKKDYLAGLRARKQRQIAESFGAY